MEKREIGNLTVETVNTLEKRYLIMCKKKIINESTDRKRDEVAENEYEKRIICETNIKGLVQTERVVEDGFESFQYNISSYQNLKRMAKIKEFRYPEIRAIVESINRLKNRLSDFLLEANRVILYPEYVFYDRIRHEILYCYNPDYSMEISESLMRFSEFIMQHTDHSDENAMEMIYGFYKKVCEGDYCFEQLFMSEQSYSKPAIYEKQESEQYKDDSEDDIEYVNRNRKSTVVFTILLMALILIVAIIICFMKIK